MSFNDDIQELVVAGYDVSRIKTPEYAHRLAQGVRRAQQEGRTAPTRAQLRGHERYTIKEIPPEGKKRGATTLTATKPNSKAKKSQLTAGDVGQLQNKHPQPGKNQTLRLVIKGKVKKYPGMPDPGNTPKKQTVSVLVAPSSLKNWIAKHPQATATDLANQFYGLRHKTEWVSVQEVLLITEDIKK